MPEPDFDPMDGLSEEDKQYLSGHRDAFQRQAAAHAKINGSDEDRKRAAEEHMRATQAAAGVPVTPQPANGAAPAPRPVAVVAAQPGKVSLMVAVPETKGNDLPIAGEKFAPDWNSMKEQIAKHTGTWIVSRHEFTSQVADILGFFGKDGWAKPTDSEKETFEAIVKNGRVFRSDPE